jgi:uncharacterized RDD family membrane protein YckC
MKSIRYAGFYPRMLAHNIDLVILLPCFYGLGAVIADNTWLLVSCWGLYTTYHILFEACAWHSTPGKKLQHIRIASESGVIPNVPQVIKRNITKVISVVLLFAGVILIALDKQHRGLHDRMAGTVVIFS